MKKLIIIGSTIIAFSAVSLFAGNNSNVYTGSIASVSDTVPKKDTTKKRDSIFLQSNENVSFLASIDTVPKKDTTKKRDSLFLALR